MCMYIYIIICVYTCIFLWQSQNLIRCLHHPQSHQAKVAPCFSSARCKGQTGLAQILKTWHLLPGSIHVFHVDKVSKSPSFLDDVPIYRKQTSIIIFPKKTWVLYIWDHHLQMGIFFRKHIWILHGILNIPGILSGIFKLRTLSGRDRASNRAPPSSWGHWQPRVHRPPRFSWELEPKLMESINLIVVWYKVIYNATIYHKNN